MALNFKSEHYPGLMKHIEIMYNYHDSTEIMESYVDSIVRYGERMDGPFVTRSINRPLDGIVEVITSSEGGTKVHINRNLLWPGHK
jgi:hypothetical protein